MYRQTTIKQYAPDLSIWGHNNVRLFLGHGSNLTLANPQNQAEFEECKLKNQALESFCESDFPTVLHRSKGK